MIEIIQIKIQHQIEDIELKYLNKNKQIFTQSNTYRKENILRQQ